MVAALALLVSAVYLSTISPNPRLVLLGQNDSPNLLRSKQVYFDAAQKILKQSLADKSKITVNSDEFSQHMKQQFPELTDVAMTLPLMGRRPVVELVAARPVLRLTSQGQTYVLDENGRVLLKQADAANLVLSDLPEVKDSTNVSVEIGKAALPRESVAFITTFVQQLKSQNITPVELTLPAQASELQVRLKEVKYYLKASVLTDARVAAGQFFAVKKRLESEGKTPSEYIDVRVEEKVYVK